MFAAASALRTGRILRFLRLMYFIPNIDHLLQGVGRAIRASFGIFAALGLLNIILALVATILFADTSPKHFGNPIKSAYSLFKVFTIEGWYEIPEEVEATKGKDSWQAKATTLYITMVLIGGGILGMGLANAVFVDEMTADNTKKAEDLILALHQEVKELRAEMNDYKTLQQHEKRKTT